MVLFQIKICSPNGFKCRFKGVKEMNNWDKTLHYISSLNVFQQIPLCKLTKLNNKLTSPRNMSQLFSGI